jgi:hypothetical protein
MKIKSLFLTSVATLGLTVATMAQNVPSYVPTSGLVGWWPFNGNANDESGNGNNGTVNGATLTTDRNSKSNSAYLFNGLSNYISGTISNFNNTTITTFSAWLNYAGDAGGKPNDTYFQYGQYGQHTFAYAYNYSGKNLDLHSKCFSITPYPTINLNNSWHHVVVVDSLTITKVYVDGNLESIYSTGIASNCYLGSNYFEMGASTGDNQYVTGKLDDIGIWNRALSQQEISALFNGCQLSVKTQPSNQTANINNNVQFVVSSSDSNATYQWQTDLGFGFQNLTNAGQYSGAQNDTLLVSNVTLTNNNQNFRCIVKSGSCMDTSKIAVLTVNNKVGVNKISQTNSFSVYPNPTQNIINVKADSKLIGGVYSIYDNMGRVVLTGKIHAENTTIELGSISDGVYSFNIGGNMNQIFKVIKK